MGAERQKRRVSMSSSAVKARVRKARKMKRDGYTVSKISQELQVVQSAVHRYLSGGVKIADKNYVNPLKKNNIGSANEKPTKNNTLTLDILNSNMLAENKLMLIKNLIG